MDAENLEIRTAQTASHFVSPSIVYARRRGARALAAGPQQRKGTMRNLANPGQETCDANVHRAQEEAGVGHTGRGGCLAKGRSIMKYRNGLAVVWGPPQKSYANVNACSF